MTLLTLSGVGAAGPTGPVITALSLEVAAGERVALLGEAGSGAEHLCAALAGGEGLRLTGDATVGETGEGRVAFATLGQLAAPPVAYMPARAETAFTPTRPLGAQIQAQVRRARRIGRGEAKSLVLWWFDRVGLKRPEAAYDALPEALPAALLARVALARALIAEPTLLLAEAPQSLADPVERAGLLAQIRQLCTASGAALLFSTADPALAAEMADRLVVFYAGSVVEDGPVAALLKAPRHPYLAGLLQCLPERALPGAPLFEMPGAMPAPGAVAKGCVYHPRCP
ncbi:MAG: oligopeptide/dipeptide ABC transporter ATP-binding protein, partial [Pseudomonadota bacterium]